MILGEQGNRLAVLEHLRTALESPVLGCPDTRTSTISVNKLQVTEDRGGLAKSLPYL